MRLMEDGKGMGEEKVDGRIGLEQKKGKEEDRRTEGKGEEEIRSEEKSIV